MSKGFSIIELLVITAIIATFSVVLILSFGFPSSSQTARYQTASVVISDVRRVQTMALAGSNYQGDITVCGYGIHYVDEMTYLIYAGVLDGSATKCKDTDHNYQPDVDLEVETKILINSRMEMRTTFLDFFFESPDPKTYINDDSSLTGSPAEITIQSKGQKNCAKKSCARVTIYPSGQIDLTQ